MTFLRSTTKKCQICRNFSRNSLIINEKLSSRLKYYQEECAPTPYSIAHFVKLSQERTQLYNLVRSEIPIRVSRVITQLPQYFPPELYEQRTAQFIQDYFEMSFKEIEALPLSITEIDPKTESKFLEVLVRAGIRLGGTTEMISEAIINSKITEDKVKLSSIQPFLKRLFHQNLSIDILVNMYKPKWTKNITSSSCIDTNNNITENIDAAYEDARYLCEQHYINAPELLVHSNTSDVTFSYISNHLYLVFFEIFKNSLRATCERFEDQEDNLPPIVVTIDRGAQHMMVSVTDQGGGMSAESLTTARMFFSTSAALTNMSLYQGAHSSPLAGHGFGIGMAEIFTRYFGGSLEISTEEGEGTNVRIMLPCDQLLAVENVERNLGFKKKLY